MNVNISFEGIPQLQAELERQKFGFISASRHATLDEANEIMDESQVQVPRDTETLANSAFVEQAGDGTVTFGYGKDNPYNPKRKENVEDYMIAVHERLDVNHPVGKAKFLEDPINEHAQKLENSLATKIRTFLGI
jgi:hypothetical protein